MYNSSSSDPEILSNPINNKNEYRFKNKNEKEWRYELLFPPYESTRNYRIYFINEATPFGEIDYLLNISYHTTSFILDTEGDYKSQVPALIQILVIQSNDEESPLLLVETKFLPDSSSLLFMKIKELFHHIFREDAHIHVWGSLLSELKPFLIYEIFTFPIRSFIFDAQTNFGTWFNQWLHHNLPSDTDIQFDNMNDSVILNAPLCDPTLLVPAQLINNEKVLKKQRWSLQDAVVYVLNQYLSKKYTLRKWSIGLDICLQNYDKQYSLNHRNKLIMYAANDCLSVAQLISFMNNSNISPVFTCLKYSDDSGKYSSIFDITLDFFSLKNNSTPISSIINEYTNDSMTVHDIDERHQIIDEAAQVVHQNLEENTTNITTNSLRPRQKRSAAAKQRRNKKSSIRHRANRYIYEIIRPVNMNIKLVKHLLRTNHIKYTNINPLNSLLYIGVKSEGDKQLYEQLLPQDMFI